ncbi:hypothetical protein HCN44_008894 [Aphidius gifuensis]|uniref:SAM domain-containing protein n=1 Tax=Aphidius gifuensis TaxID=684658 RepID=A0A834XS27_APHGI|nr:hypothetical protein HCN44_008894 [Aphidius gifuensis]
MLDELIWTETESENDDDEDDDGACSPSKLTKLAGDVVNNIPLPRCWQWNMDQVVNWIDHTVKLPQYKECFKMNFINGRRLLLLEDHLLSRIGICNLSHTRIVMNEIRKLSGFEKIDWNKNISYPQRHPMTMYVQYRVPTGPIRDTITRVEYFKKIGILNNFKSCLDESKSNKLPCTRFGLVKRKNVYQN